MIFCLGPLLSPRCSVALARTHRASCMQEGEKEGSLFVWLQKRENLGRAFLVARPHDLDGLGESCRQSLHPMTIPLLIPTQALDLDLVWR